MTSPPPTLHLRPGNPDFEDLPWEQPLAEWQPLCPRLEEVQRGLSRHTVVFVNYSGKLYALKELPGDLAHQEFKLLREMEELGLPAVIPVGYAQIASPHHHASVLITRYLERSLPYRSLFMRSSLKRYREHLLDAMAGLLVQLHLAGVFWGDCSLSNTLFRRDAGALQAYLVDAETSETHPPRLSPLLRFHDLEIMEEEITGDLADLAALGYLPSNYPIQETGNYIRQRYQSLWQEITFEPLISPDERFRIQERIRALNRLGFSVGRIVLDSTQEGEKLRLRVVVTDRNFHRNLLLGLTGLEAEEMQARKMMNEIQEMRAALSQIQNRSISLSAAAYHWLENYYLPVVAQLEQWLQHAPELAEKASRDEKLSPAELYCQVLEHKWFLSERAQRDVGHQAAVQDYIQQISLPGVSG